MHQSTLVTLDSVISNGQLFNIPVYQRLYVWGRDQIRLLLDDMVTACETRGKHAYYLGGTLVIRQENPSTERPLLDLIDGQQRFTTLWLLSIALQRMVAVRGKGETNHLADYRFAVSDDHREPRIRFAVRPEVGRFFDALLEGRDIPQTPAAGTLGDAISEMEGYFKEHSGLCLDRLSRFVRHNVQLVLTTVPAGTDLNKLFEVINNRGAQLQHHEILKARLLGCLPSGEREIYGQLWDACSYMNDYVEKNLRTATGLKLVPLFAGTRDGGDGEALADPVRVRSALKALATEGKEENLRLDDILAGRVTPETGSLVDPGEETYEADVARSIISFPMLLQHVLRIFLQRRGRPDIARILDRELLRIFRDGWLDALPPGQGEAEAREFVDLLWRSRYLLDKHVIRWVKDDDEEIHAIRRPGINGSSLVREHREADRGFALLQSMLYHSQQLATHYWLTPLLGYLLDHGGERAYLYLKYLDNHLFCSNGGDPLVVRTRRFLDDPWHGGDGLRNLRDPLEKGDGTGFSHYWFYKLEYVLWEKYRERKGAAWQAFRMTAKNSVEHVSPQNPMSYDSNKVSREVLDTFGNLALVSRSINSEFGNKPYLEKRARFLDSNAVRADSLKLALVYEEPYWNDVRAGEHQDLMIRELEDYVIKVDREAGIRP
jgi:hypothetical protein